MEPQLPIRNQEGKFPVQIVSYSDSDWAGCQKSRKSTSGSLVSLFNVSLQSTSRTQASIAHSSAESALYAVTQSAVSLAIKNFIQEFSSAILSSSVSIVTQTDSSRRKSMASRLGISSSSSTSGFRMESKRANWSSRRSELTSARQMFSQNGFQHQFFVRIFLIFEYLQGQVQKVSNKTSSVFIPPSATLIIIDHAEDVVNLHVLLQQL